MAALIYLILSRSRVPDRSQLVRLITAAIGMVVLFPIFISIALKFVPATHASVLGSILPLMTAVFGVLRGRESVSRGFWIFAVLGTALIGLFSACRSGFHSIEQADVLLIMAFITCSYGYAEGGLLAPIFHTPIQIAGSSFANWTIMSHFRRVQGAVGL